jgi:hypothetical protein
MRRGRILRVKLGYNPNSSSLGTTIQVLLYGSAVLALIAVALSTVVRLTRRAKAPQDAESQDH